MTSAFTTQQPLHVSFCGTQEHCLCQSNSRCCFFVKFGNPWNWVVLSAHGPSSFFYGLGLGWYFGGIGFCVAAQFHALSFFLGGGRANWGT